MATDPVKDHVFYVANMEQLQGLLQGIGESTCKSKWTLMLRNKLFIVV